MSDVYVSKERRDAVLAAYDARLDALRRAMPVEVRDVPTSIGATRVLLMGPRDAPPLVVLHGANGDAVQMASPLSTLATEHRCVFIDVPGEPNRSAETKLDLTNDTVGRWMTELLDALDVGDAAFWGMSGGGYLVLRCATTIPRRIRRAVLIVPAGFVPMGDFPEPTGENARAFVESVTAPDCGLPPAALEQLVAQTRVVLGALREPFTLVGPTFQPIEFADFDAPVLVAAGGRDVIFPGEALLDRAHEVLPRVDVELFLPDANHVHLDWVFEGPVLDEARRFLRR